jgi:trk system potassium uptake protein TrkH
VVIYRRDAISVAFDSRLDFVGALSRSASMLGNAGPAMTGVTPETAAAALSQQGVMATTFGLNLGPLGGYGDLGAFTKLSMSFQMVLGRLELITLLALFSPSFWRK